MKICRENIPGIKSMLIKMDTGGLVSTRWKVRPDSGARRWPHLIPTQSFYLRVDRFQCQLFSPGMKGRIDEGKLALWSGHVLCCQNLMDHWWFNISGWFFFLVCNWAICRNPYALFFFRSVWRYGHCLNELHCINVQFVGVICQFVCHLSSSCG